MNVGGGEAADQLVRMMLSGSEEIVKLTGVVRHIIGGGFRQNKISTVTLFDT